MQWYRAQAAFKDHPKVKRLSRYLKIPRVLAFGHIHCLFCDVATHAENGNLRTFSVRDIAESADWSGKKEVFLRAMVKASILEKVGKGHYKVHDWLVWNAPNLNEVIRKRKWREKQRQVAAGVDSPVTEDGTGTGHARPTDGRTDGTNVRTEGGTPGGASPPPIPGVREPGTKKEYGYRGVLRAMGESWNENGELLGIGSRDGSPALYAYDETVGGWEWTRKHLAKGLRDKEEA